MQSDQSTGSSGKSVGRFNFSIVILIVVLALAVIGAGVSLASTPKAAQYACLSISNQGNDVVVDTSGIIHISGSQYYVTCGEGANNPTTGISSSCVSISPQVRAYDYPDGSTTILYYVTAQGHAITVSGAPANATEILQPADASIQVSC